MSPPDRPRTRTNRSGRPSGREATRWARPSAALVLAALGTACTERTGPAPVVAAAPDAVPAAAESVVEAAGAPATAPAPGLVAGDPAPDVRFVALDGTRPALRGLARATLVSFWATDCRVCLVEGPELVALRERLAPRDFELVSVAMPYDRPDLVLGHVEASGWTHPVALDVDGATLAAFEPVPGTPTAFLVGPDATVLERWSGPTDFPALEARLDALLPPAPAARPAARPVPAAHPPAG